ncbi:MAG: hypothetical protein ACQETO_03710 [Pseudomonadota bacterium]
MNTTLRHRLIAALVTTGLIGTAPAVAQTADTGTDGTTPSLQLFEPVDRPESTPAQRPGTSRGVSNAGGDGPRFELVGTSRFGNRYRARLRSADGQVVTVEVHSGETATVPGHPGFRVEVPGARQVIVSHPGSTPCVADEERGVACLAGGRQSRLQLATAAPLAPREEAPSEENGGDQQEGEDSAQSDNPFARALRAAREGNSEDEAAARARAQRFQQRRRIDPEDVPEGFRVVRTPFGDRLIEE